jgi:RNA polymerase sigma factor (sigma-70 family)
MEIVDGRTDVELLAATPGEARAFGVFYGRHERSLLSFFRRSSGSAEVAADLTAETFASALESLPGFRAELGDPGAWLFGIARHVLSRSLERGRVEDRARRRLALPVLVVDDEAIERIDAMAGDGGAVMGLVAGLPEPTRDAVLGRVVDEDDYDELAARLHCSESVVRKRVSRGLAQLRSQMKEGSR